MEKLKLEAELTAKEIREFDILSRDKRGIDETLKIAMQYHANISSEQERRMRKWWDETLENHDLPSTKTHKYHVCNKSANLKIVEGSGDNHGC